MLPNRAVWHDFKVIHTRTIGLIGVAAVALTELRCRRDVWVDSFKCFTVSLAKQ